jgi:hypothetical protein
VRIQLTNGRSEWYKDRKLHREGGPALIHSDGTQFWYRDGKLHREDGPAITYVDGTCIWYKHGVQMYHPSQNGSAPRVVPQHEDIPCYENDESACVICYCNRSVMKYYPCNHLIACVTCSSRIDTCPMCRSAIRDKMYVSPVVS